MSRRVDTPSAAVLVTGATGNVGSEVCRYLASSSATVYAAVRRLPSERDDRLHGATPRVFDFTDKSTWASALEGVTALFLLRPPHISNIKRDMRPFLEYAKKRSIDRIVFLSVQGAANNPIVPHHRVERTIVELDIPYTFLRPSFFMQNLTTTHLREVRDEHRIFVPAGGGTTNFIDVRDIGEAAARVLSTDENENGAYTLTGRENYSYYEVAEHLSGILGVEVRYEPARLLPFVRYQLRCGRSLGHAMVMYALYSVTRMGKAGGATDHLQRILRREPRSLDEFIDDHREVLAGPGVTAEPL